MYYFSKLNWITVPMCSRTFAQKMALIKWMLASPCDRQDSQRKKKNFIKIVMVLHSSNYNRASDIFFDYSACCMVTLAFIWLTQSFEQTSFYTLLP
jgi:hypothetical protein